MANQYGTKAWAKWAKDNLDFTLMLLKEPSKQWDEETTYLECSIKTLSIISTELKEIFKREE